MTCVLFLLFEFNRILVYTFTLFILYTFTLFILYTLTLFILYTFTLLNQTELSFILFICNTFIVKTTYNRKKAKNLCLIDQIGIVSHTLFYRNVREGF